MVYLVTGGINQGKTAKLLSLYHQLKCGEGFMLRKMYKAGNNIGQEIVCMSSGESRRFSFIEGFIPAEWDEECRYDRYSFSRQGLQFARQIAEKMMKTGVEPLFIDEIGPLELANKGFYHIFLRFLKNGKTIYAVVRDECFRDVVFKFNIKGYKKIRV